MFDPVSTQSKEIRSLIDDALRSLGHLNTAEYSVEYSAISEYGEFSSNAAFVYSKKAVIPPTKLADQLAIYISDKSHMFSSVFASDPGYLNFCMAPYWYQTVLSEILSIGDLYGLDNTRVLDGSLTISDNMRNISHTDLLYDYAWLCSINRSFNCVRDNITDPSTIAPKNNIERSLFNTIILFPSITSKAFKDNDPSVVLRYLLNVTSLYRSFRDEFGIMFGLKAFKSDDLLLCSRLVIQILHNGLVLLSIEPNEYL